MTAGSGATATDTAERSAEPSDPRGGTSMAPAVEQQRRLCPRLWDADWLVLRGMHAAIAGLAARIARPGMIALDFGCGSKPYERLFTGLGVTYLGADFDASHAFPIGADGRLGAPDKACDIVVSFQVLEHVRDIDTYLAEARRVLRDDGHLLLSTHGTWLYHPHPEDHRRWTREGLVGDISLRGFEVIECIPVVGPLAWTTMVRLTCARYALVRVPLVGKAIASLLAIVMNIRGWMEDRVTPGWVTKENACVYVTLSRLALADPR